MIRSILTRRAGPRTTHAWRIVSATIAVLLAAACGSAGSTQTTSQATAIAPSSDLSSSPSPAVGGPHLTYVALGDSLLYALEEDCNSCTSAAVAYGEQIEADLGMPVEVHNLTMHNGLTSAGLLAYLMDGAQIGRVPEDVLKAVSGADIVSVTIGFNDFDPSNTGSASVVMKTFETNLDGILSRVVGLRSGKPTIIRVMQVYNNGIAPTPASDPDGPGSGIRVWKPIVDAQNEVVCRLAAKYKAGCVDIYHPFNGKDGTESPAAKGYLGTDGTHPSQLGMDAIADALAASGYAPLR